MGGLKPMAPSGEPGEEDSAGEEDSWAAKETSAEVEASVVVVEMCLARGVSSSSSMVESCIGGTSWPKAKGTG
ncbi:unnamed protein product [Linum trigynum]|uniref:Uncharacterized protein n=1 Tax=Linum trigynum TaxID=586398 RepID=A0AAV2GR47_9ROSI